MAEYLLQGPVGQSVLNVDLLSGDVNGWIYIGEHSGVAVQIIASAGISAGTIIFEQTNDPVNAPAGVAMPAVETSSLVTNPFVTAITIAASTARLFLMQPAAAYMRVRVAAAFVGGTVQAEAMLRQKARDYASVTVQQATAASLLATVTPTGGAIFTLLAASTTNATSVKATSGAIHNISAFNFSALTRYLKIFNKASAPVLGTDLPILTIPIAPGAFFSQPFGFQGLRCSSGIAIAMTAGVAENDATIVVAGDLRATISYI